MGNKSSRASKERAVGYHGNDIQDSFEGTFLVAPQQPPVSLDTSLRASNRPDDSADSPFITGEDALHAALRAAIMNRSPDQLTDLICDALGPQPLLLLEYINTAFSELMWVHPSLLPPHFTSTASSIPSMHTPSLAVLRPGAMEPLSPRIRLFLDLLNSPDRTLLLRLRGPRTASQTTPTNSNAPTRTTDRKLDSLIGDVADMRRAISSFKSTVRDNPLPARTNRAVERGLPYSLLDDDDLFDEEHFVIDEDDTWDPFATARAQAGHTETMVELTTLSAVSSTDEDCSYPSLRGRANDEDEARTHRRTSAAPTKVVSERKARGVLPFSRRHRCTGEGGPVSSMVVRAHAYPLGWMLAPASQELSHGYGFSVDTHARTLALLVAAGAHPAGSAAYLSSRTQPQGDGARQSPLMALATKLHAPAVVALTQWSNSPWAAVTMLTAAAALYRTALAGVWAGDGPWRAQCLPADVVQRCTHPVALDIALTATGALPVAAHTPSAVIIQAAAPQLGAYINTTHARAAHASPAVARAFLLWLDAALPCDLPHVHTHESETPSHVQFAAIHARRARALELLQVLFARGLSLQTTLHVPMGTGQEESGIPLVSVPLEELWRLLGVPTALRSTHGEASSEYITATGAQVATAVTVGHAIRLRVFLWHKALMTAGVEVSDYSAPANGHQVSLLRKIRDVLRECGVSVPMEMNGDDDSLDIPSPSSAEAPADAMTIILMANPPELDPCLIDIESMARDGIRNNHVRILLQTYQPDSDIDKRWLEKLSSHSVITGGSNDQHAPTGPLQTTKNNMQEDGQDSSTSSEDDDYDEFGSSIRRRKDVLQELVNELLSEK